MAQEAKFTLTSVKLYVKERPVVVPISTQGSAVYIQVHLMPMLVWSVVEREVSEDDDAPVVRRAEPSVPCTSTVRGLVQMAYAVSLDVRLQSGISLGRATQADLIEEAVYRRTRAGQEWRWAKFFALLARHVDRGVVADTFGDRELQTVFTEAEHATVDVLPPVTQRQALPHAAGVIEE